MHLVLCEADPSEELEKYIDEVAIWAERHRLGTLQTQFFRMDTPDLKPIEAFRHPGEPTNSSVSITEPISAIYFLRDFRRLSRCDHFLMAHLTAKPVTMNFDSIASPSEPKFLVVRGPNSTALNLLDSLAGPNWNLSFKANNRFFSRALFQAAWRMRLRLATGPVRHVIIAGLTVSGTAWAPVRFIARLILEKLRSQPKYLGRAWLSEALKPSGIVNIGSKGSFFEVRNVSWVSRLDSLESRQ